MKILVVDDEISILKLLKMTLQLEGHEILLAKDAIEALNIIAKNYPDIIILDAMLPDIDGFNLIGKIKRIKDIPIIMLTAKSDMNDKLLGLQLGADDYITKPFNSRELILRINVIKKRILKSKTNEDKKVIKVGELTLIPNEKKVLVKDESVTLTYKEFKVLNYLCENPGRVFTRDELLTKVWGYDFEGTTRAVNILIQRIRKKLGPCQNYIKTIYGLGYKLDVNEED
ncbi:response regulator transcription factor [Clostridium botulinum]|uniref:response regulator transcription factor n=1 Tax=Clostridium botulinum TaxID=1491 RepID=UPI000314115F|nr:response regulator transcription factor [Clostridium botulinum]KLU74568.1 XRE family transcriptional regulator [Clostridium botulinum V891]KOA73260.1 XRE family transcriptional regulator [Clostridium botulinum]KOA91188.1 XRE family transcriptional regulator [Clostridium botulinum]KOC32915.1 XRE family transcriptional regulator [Clostridium botulinum]MCD3204044.1 response regulator transcription factor [Clostridium botulinum C/D]